MEVKRTNGVFMHKILEEKKTDSNLIGIGCFNKSLDQQLFSHCKEIYLVSEAEKRNWQILPRQKYPMPLIFHDGRLAFRPTFFATLAMFMWAPLGFFICIIRIIVGLLLPYKVSFPILAFIGIRWTLSGPNSITPINNEKKSRGVLYVCNHRTLLDPLYISMAVVKPLTAVTYSLSRFSELLAPIKTVRLTRDREKDSKMMENLISHGDLVICPEGTTCREPFLLRFSPLFAELSDEIVPVALDLQVSMFYGTTASGRKWLDPIFFLSNPYPYYSVKFLGKLPTSYTCGAGGKSRIEVANHVQTEIAKALGFECTNYTRKEKYKILAGNGGYLRD
ncbi:hypothetical protein F0562_020050 [Nyssa sinensis]|uniref:Phospholipid/glycerol acyltransferase domain-containing protein n=1 Tax=Nyssa sinensis TaxID=561372 RepID=A0A5J5BRL6_9ASTE|nr:hypothetical protein F0562_020050 [Nyssa sinensis]